MKQTAVEFLVKGLPMVYWEDPYYSHLLEQAKEMEKQQIINAYLKDRPKATITKVLVTWDKAEQYYNEKFKK